MIEMLLLSLVWLFYFSPLLGLIAFVTSLCLFLSARKKNKKAPDTIPEETVRHHKKTMIISGIVTLVLAGVCWTSILLFAMSLRFM